MPSSPALHPSDQIPYPPSTDLLPKNPDSDVDDEDEDDGEEYEEIEVEEEVEEEEIEVEEEVELEEEVEDDLSPTHDEDRLNNVRQVLESEEHGDNLSADVASSEISMRDVTQDVVPIVKDIGATFKVSSPSEARQREKLDINGRTIPEECSGAQHENNVFTGDMTTGNTEVTKLGCISVEEGTAQTQRFTKDDGCGDDENNSRLDFEKEAEPNAMQSVERSPLSQIRPRSDSPGAELNERNKRLAVVCDFFAKGWCIKGKSCRFLHVRNLENTSNDMKKELVAASDEKCELSAVEDIRDSSKRSELSCPKVAAPLSAKISTWDDGQSPRCSLSMELSSHKYSPRSFSSFRDVGKDSFSQTWCANDYGQSTSSFDSGSSPMCGNVSSYRASSSSVDRLSHVYQSSGFPSSGTSVEGIASKRGDLRLDYHTLRSSATFLTSGILPSTLSSSKSPLSFSPISNHVDASDSKTHRYNSQGYQAPKSAIKRSSPYFGYESVHSLSDVSTDNLAATDFKTKIPIDDWEPSVPFRPSFFITSLSSPGSQYDPFRDSIEQPNSEDASKVSAVGQANNSVLGVNSVSKGNIGPDRSADKHSVANHLNFHDTLGKNPSNKRLAISETIQIDTSAVKEKKPLVPCIGNALNCEKSGVSCDSGLKSDRQKNKVESSRAHIEMDVGLGTDGTMQKEPKVLKYFRTSLVDFVKDLVKPTWRDGHISKDAHKMVVKKTVEKVLSTLPVHQIPCTADLIKQHLLSSQPKIAKLVEAYIDKYGKC